MNNLNKYMLFSRNKVESKKYFFELCVHLTHCIITLFYLCSTILLIQAVFTESKDGSKQDKFSFKIYENG